MRFWKAFALLLLFITGSTSIYISLHASANTKSSKTKMKEKSLPFFYLVIPSYNNELWAKKNLESIICQTYTNWHACYINDASQDATGQVVESFIKEHHLENKFTVIHNQTRLGALANTYHAIHLADPRSIVVMIDGDDQLINDGALELVAKTYTKHPDTWLTYGSYASHPHMKRCICKEFSNSVKKNHTFRKVRYLSSHLRTFYAGLFQHINKEDLQRNGEFLPSAGDVAYMLPMLEMAAHNHYRFISEVLYLYRVDNPLNDFRNRPLQAECSKYVRSLQPYKPLNKATWLE